MSRPSSRLTVGRRRELHRAGDLELVAVEQLDGGGHAAGVAAWSRGRACAARPSAAARPRSGRCGPRRRRSRQSPPLAEADTRRKVLSIMTKLGFSRVADPLSAASAARRGVSRASSGSDRSSPSIQTSIAPNTAAAMHRAVTVICIRSSVPGFGGLSPRRGAPRPPRRSPPRPGGCAGRSGRGRVPGPAARRSW